MSYQKENENAITLIHFTYQGEKFSFESDEDRNSISRAIDDVRYADKNTSLIIRSLDSNIHIPQHVLLTTVLMISDI